MASVASSGSIPGKGRRETGRKDGAGNSHRKNRQSTVMIVDDQSTGRRILQKLVTSLDPTLLVKVFEDAADALAFAARHTPDLVITDYKMPLMDGVELTRRFRAIPGCTDVPLMVVTVVDDRRIRYEALDAGATDFITRPIDFQECRARCRNLLTMRAQQRTIRDRAKWLERQVSLATAEIRSRERETLLRLAKAGEYRDEVTGNHILRIGRYSRVLAARMGLNGAACDELEVAAPMHDIGKIGIPDQILLKPGRLSRDEFRIMQRHTTIGHMILKDSPSRYLQSGAEIALAHHERFDGTGYPNRLRGQAIPLSARIVAVADVYDALSSVRPYKKAWTVKDSAIYIRDEAGKHFDPECVNAFLATFKEIRGIQLQLKEDEPG